MRNRWGMFGILLICAIAVCLSQLKIAAVLEPVAAMLHVDINKASLLMSVFTLAGIALSIPGSALMAKTGIKNMLLILMLCLVAGNLLGAFTNHFAVVMVSRAIEGMAFAMIINVGVSLINLWFEGSSVGIATGAFDTFSAIGNFVAMNGTLIVLSIFHNNLKSLWYVMAAISAICFILAFFFIKTPEHRAEDVSEEAVGEKVSLMEAIKNPAVLLTCIGMLCVAFFLFGYITCYPQIFTWYGIPKETANFYSSLNGLFGVPACLICGLIVGKSGKPFALAIFGAIGCILVGFSTPYLTPSLYIVHIIGCAIFPGSFVMTVMYIIIPRVCGRPEMIGYSMGLLNTFYYIGVFFSTPVLTVLSKGNTTWTAPSVVLGICGVVVLACMVFGLRFARKADPDIG